MDFYKLTYDRSDKKYNGEKIISSISGAGKQSHCWAYTPRNQN